MNGLERIAYSIIGVLAVVLHVLVIGGLMLGFVVILMPNSTIVRTVFDCIKGQL